MQVSQVLVFSMDEDIFQKAIKRAGGDENLEALVADWITHYGNGEVITVSKKENNKP